MNVTGSFRRPGIEMFHKKLWNHKESASVDSNHTNNLTIGWTQRSSKKWQKEQ